MDGDKYVHICQLQIKSMNLDGFIHRGCEDLLAIWWKTDRVDIVSVLWKSCHNLSCLCIPDLNCFPIVGWIFCYPLPIGWDSTAPCASGCEHHSKGTFLMLLWRPRHKSSCTCIPNADIPTRWCWDNSLSIRREFHKHNPVFMSSQRPPDESARLHIPDSDGLVLRPWG